jgi:hypothetical protein
VGFHPGREFVILHPVTLWLALRRLLPLLAVLSLALTPVAAPAAALGLHAPMATQPSATAMDRDHGAGTIQAAGEGMDADGMGMDGMGMDDMPCCPKAPKPDCTGHCPLMALCLASMASLPPAAIPVPVPVSTRTSPSWPDFATFASLSGAPLPEPPRA